MTTPRNFDPAIYLVTDEALCGERGVVQTVIEAVDGGVTTVQLRHKSATDDEMLATLMQLAHAVGHRVTLLINDRVEVFTRALALGLNVHGVHVGQSDSDPVAVRTLIGDDAILGLSANTAAHLAAASALPPGTIDYLGVGAIHATSTKLDHPPVLGIDGFRAVAGAATAGSFGSASLPCVAIGGIGAADVAPLRAAGAAGVAVVSVICAADDARVTAARLSEEWAKGEAEALRSESLRSGSAQIPRVLSIAGTDPTGGAGIHADLKSIAANGGYGMAAVTVLVAQNTQGVRATHVPPAAFLIEQLNAVSDDVAIDAVKIGMLGDVAIIEVVAGWLARAAPPIVVLDPVMIATSGDRLLDEAAEGSLRALIPLVDLVTPNLPELAILINEPVALTWECALDQGLRLSRATGTRVLVKGGHLAGAVCPDALVDARSGEAPYEVEGIRINTLNTHGTGCSMSAALATRQAMHGDWRRSLIETKAWLSDSIRAADELHVGAGNGPINHFHALWTRAQTLAESTSLTPLSAPNKGTLSWPQ